MVDGFLINLDRAPERVEAFREHNSALCGIRIHRITAVDGTNITHKRKYLSKWMYLTHEPSKFNINAAIGCFLSHRECWKQIVSRQLPFGLILEDDVVAGKHAAPFLEEYQRNPLPHDIIRLHVHRRRYQERQERKVECQLNEVNLAVNLGGVKSAAAYVITYQGALKALQMNKLLAPLDHFEWLFAVAGVTFVHTRDNLFEISDELPSYISRHSGNKVSRLPAVIRIGLLRSTLGKYLNVRNFRVANELARKELG